MEEAIFAYQCLDRDGRRMKTPKRIPGHGNSHHRSFDLGLMNGAVLGGGGGGGAGRSQADPYSIPSYSNVGDLAYHTELPPPLLPLPPLPLSRSYSSNIIKAISYPPPANSKTTRKPNKSPSSSPSSLLASSPLAPRKSSHQPKPHPKKDQKNTPKPTSTPRPDPSEFPRDGFKVSLNPGNQAAAGSEVSGPSIFILAPPPSSLPLPSFALRPKLGCNAEAAASVSGIPVKDTLRQIQRIP